MRNPMIVLIVLGSFVLANCGRENISFKRSNVTEDEALATLMNVPDTDLRAARGGRSVSVEGLIKLLQELIASGRVKLSTGQRQAVSMDNLSTLTSLFSLLNSGGVNTLSGLATGLVNANAGNATTTGSKIDSIVAILQMLAPIVASVAPQFSGILNALIVILPLISTIVAMFKKPKPAPASAWLAILPHRMV